MRRRHQFAIRKPEYLRDFAAFQAKESFAGIQAALDQFAPAGTWDVCDVMSGTGIVGQTIKQTYPDQVRSMSFVDGSKAMLEATETSDKKILASVDHIPLEDEAFDVIVCRAGFNNLEKRAYPDTLKEMLRILKKDGALIIQDHFPLSQTQSVVINAIEQRVASLEGRDDIPYIPSVQNFSQLVEQAGAHVVDNQTFLLQVNFTKRFEQKNLPVADLQEIIKELDRYPGTLMYSNTNEGLLITSPVVTLTIKKS